MRGLQKRHFTHGRAVHQFGMAVAHPDQLLFKCNAFFEQLQFVFVVVVADCKTAQFQRHEYSLVRQDRGILSQQRDPYQLKVTQTG